ncbi:MAG: hypothetical protein P9L94_08655 [Candidatus Hinthialibacter antarcticus]|nr:hypothetical protein [Candidatus Hinthialibacter antarcticus]
MRASLLLRTGMLTGISLFVITSMSAVHADRGGYADPPGGWTFVEDWNGDIPPADDLPDAKWQHNNGSDSYSGNAHTEEFNEFEIYIAPDVLVGDVVRIETIAGIGDTEDGVNPAADASVLRLVDIGDPRALGFSDPSDRKIFFTGPLHAPGELDADPFENGVTFIARLRIFPIFPDPDIGVGQDLVDLALDPDGDGEPNGDGSLRFIPEASNRAHVGIGYVDPDDDLVRALVGVGYYNAGSLEVLVNDASTVAGDATGRDGDENVPVLSDIDTTAFHTVWVSAKVSDSDPGAITVRAFADGSTTPVIATILRNDGAAAAADRPNAQEMGGDQWTGFKQLAFNIGSAGTNAAGGFQFDYMCATLAGAFDPQAAGGSDVAAWELY